MYSDYGFTMDAETALALSVIGRVFLLIFGIFLVFGIVLYVLEALGQYTIAKRRGIRKPWLAWIPIANVWTLGCISDQYQYVAKGRVRSRRKVLLVLDILTAIAACATIVMYFRFILSILGSIPELDYMTDAEALERFFYPMMEMLAGCVVMVPLAIALTVFAYIALYDLYCSCDPRYSVMYLVLSILFGVVTPFFIFAVRNKDDGMPPRRVDAQPQTPPAVQPGWHAIDSTSAAPDWQPTAPREEPWEQKDSEN